MRKAPPHADTQWASACLSRASPLLFTTTILCAAPSLAQQYSWTETTQKLNDAILRREYSRAEEIARSGLAVAQRSHSQSEICQANAYIAKALLKRGRFSDAEPFFRDALATALQLKAGFRQDEDMVTALDDLATVYYSEDSEQYKERAFKHALEIFDKLFGTNHPKLIDMLAKLARYYKEHGRYQEAVPHYLRALKLNGMDNPYTREKYLWSLGECYENMNDLKNAEKQYRASLALTDKLGPDKKATSRMRSFARFLRITNRPAEADKLIARAVSLKPQERKRVTSSEVFKPFMQEFAREQLNKTKKKPMP
ncbi:MAG TPA: tetratricopeptide repeat protein [Candidatus Obscuribacterales bacterium]